MITSTTSIATTITSLLQPSIQSWGFFKMFQVVEMIFYKWISGNGCLLSWKSAAWWVLCICRCFFIWSTYFVHESSTIVVVFFKKEYKYLNTASLEIYHIKESDKKLLLSALHQSESIGKTWIFIFVTFKVWQPSKPPMVSICEKSNTTTLPDKV